MRAIVTAIGSRRETSVNVVGYRGRRLFLTTFASLIAVPGSVLVAAAQQPDAVQPAPVPAVPGAAEPQSPDEIARRTGQRVELPGRTNETTQVFAEPNGLHTMEQYAEPVRARQGTRWVPIDTRLAFRPDGSVRPGATPTSLRLSGGGDGTGLVSLGLGSRQVRMGWHGKLPRPVLSGSSATYREVLPGVDLRIDASKTGFAQVLVVKNRAAAANPRLRELRFPLSGTGLTFTTRPDGTTLAKDPGGKTVFRSGTPAMWDSATASAGEADDSVLRSMPVKQAGGELVVRPDVALLTGAKTRFPLFIDPGWDPAAQFWSHVNEMAPDESYWPHNPIKDRERAKVGFSYDRAVRYRSFFQFRTEGLNGARVISAKMNITLDHSPDGVSRPIDMYLTHGIHPDNWLSWNNSRGHWIKWLAQASGFAREHDMAMGFGGDAVKNETQIIADNRGGQITFGLRAPDENNNLQWKKFHPDAKFVVTYNNRPRIPQKVNFSRPLKCGTETAPTMINTTTPSFSAVASDPDGDNVTTRLAIHRAGTNVLEYQIDSATTSSGAAFAWPTVPAGELVDGGKYYFVARTNDNVPDDGIEFGEDSPRCYFGVDTKPPNKPSIASSDFPNGEPGPVKAWETGIVTLRPAAGDTDVVEYRFGSQQDKLTSRIKANPDGTAQLPQVVWPDSSTGVPTRRLYVKSVDAAGWSSATSDAYDLSPLENDRPARVRGDINGDGRADVNLVLDHGFGRTAVWNLTAKQGGFNNGTMSWDSDVNGGFALYRTRAVQGDFDDVGGADVALFREEAGRRVSLYLLKSDGNRYDAQNPALWNSGSAGWALSSARILGGEVNGDRKADIVVQLNTTNGGWRTLVFLGGALGSPVEWSRTAAGSGDWAQSAPVLADVDNDGKDDLVELRNLGSCRTVANVYKSSGAAFATAPAQLFDSGAGQYCWEKSKPAAGDVDGDGRDDVVAMYENGVSDLSLKVFRSTGTAMTLADWSRVTSFDPAQVALSVGDYSADGKDDVALVHSLPDGGREVHNQTSTGTSFSAPVSGWKEPRVGASTGPSFDIEHRTYELVARGSNKCLEVEGGSQNVPAVHQQWDCTGGLHQRFRIVPQAGTDQYEIHSVHVNVPATGTHAGKARCIDVGDHSTADNAAVVQWPCAGTANQQVLIEYIEGSSYDTVVRLKFAHSDKCAAIPGGDTTNGADLKQFTCAAGASQQWILRAAFNPTQLNGRYRVSSQLNNAWVLDIANCVPDQGIRLWDWVAGSPCQSWWLKPLGDDQYQIIDPSSNTAVQTNGCSTDNEGAIKAIPVDRQIGCQAWRIEPANGSHSITQVKTGKALDVPGCGAKGKGSDLIIWPYWNGACQQWKLDRVGEPPAQ